jgi:hypothetical protein
VESGAQPDRMDGKPGCRPWYHRRDFQERRENPKNPDGFLI